MGAQDKTDSLVRISALPLVLLQKNEANPNKMRPREFDLLCDNMNLTGWTDPALVRPVDLKAMQKAVKDSGGSAQKLVELMLSRSIMLRIIGGHHRYDAATYLGFDTGPVTVIMDPEFDADREAFQIVRMNVIHGRLDPAAFSAMVNALSDKYSDEVMQDSFGFAEEAEFKKLLNQMAKSLPDKVTQDKFKEAAQEIKTIDGLAKLLNHMFTTYGDTLPFGYMVFDYGGQRSMWLRVEAKTMKALDIIGQVCVAKQRTMDDMVGRVLQLIAKEGQDEFINALVDETPEVEIPKTFPGIPSKDNLKALSGEL